MDADDRRDDNISPEERKVWQHLVLTDPGSPALLFLSRDYLNKGIAGPALVLAQRIRTAHPYHLEASVLAAKALIMQNKNEAARELISTTLKSLEDLTPVLKELAGLVGQFGDEQIANGIGRAADLISPSETPDAVEPQDDEGEAVPTETLADLYLKQGFKDKALEIYRKLLKTRPDDEDLMAKIRELSSEDAQSPEAADSIEMENYDSPPQEPDESGSVDDQKKKAVRKLERLRSAARRRRETVGAA